MFLGAVPRVPTAPAREQLGLSAAVPLLAALGAFQSVGHVDVSSAVRLNALPSGKANFRPQLQKA